MCAGAQALGSAFAAFPGALAGLEVEQLGFKLVLTCDASVVSG